MEVWATKRDRRLRREQSVEFGLIAAGGQEDNEKANAKDATDAKDRYGIRGEPFASSASFAFAFHSKPPFHPRWVGVAGGRLVCRRAVGPGFSGTNHHTTVFLACSWWREWERHVAAKYYGP